MYRLDTLALIGKNLIPICPKSLKTLAITMPGGQPDYTGPHKLLGALSSLCTGTDQPLSSLEFIHLSVHLSPQITSCPEQLALGIAQRLPALRHVSLVSDPQRLQTAQKLSLYELIETRGDEGNSRRDATSWRVLRDAYTDNACSDPGDGIRLKEV
ncbi:hypothetical protein RSOLAG22IIIB_00023 [Rhizoctonia solani]|nr:hypothetical protein RSOLAG22IIIB_00023 [Rhizoctonia solani]